MQKTGHTRHEDVLESLANDEANVFPMPGHTRHEDDLESLANDEANVLPMPGLTRHEDDPECLAKLLEARKSQGPHELEISFRGESALLKFYQHCTKNPGHVLFVPFTQFTAESLPVRYRDANVVEMIKALADRTVGISVDTISKARPQMFPNSKKPYPFANLKSQNVTRYGTGFLLLVVKYSDEDNTCCRCPECKMSPEPQKRWGKIWVETAAHVVFDDQEGKHTACHFYNDTCNVTHTAYPSLSRAATTYGSIEHDWTVLCYYSHDMNFLDQLDDTYTRCLSSWSRVRGKYKPHVMGGQILGDDFHVQIRKLTQYRFIVSNIIKNKPNQKANDMEEDFMHLSVVYKKWLGYMNMLKHVTYPFHLSDDARKEKSEGSNLQGQTPGQAAQGDKSGFESNNLGNDQKGTVSSGKNTPDKNRQENLDNITFESPVTTNSEGAVDDRSQSPVYNPAHPFTVVVSHPHGCSKMISLGELQHRIPVQGNRATYLYTAATCPGSSLYLRQMWIVAAHLHSYAEFNPLKQVNARSAGLEF